MRPGVLINYFPSGVVHNPYTSVRVLRALLEEIIAELQVQANCLTYASPRNKDHIQAILHSMMAGVDFRGRPLLRWFDTDLRMYGRDVLVEFLPVDEFAERLAQQLDMGKSVVAFVRELPPTPSYDVKRVVDL